MGKQGPCHHCGVTSELLCLNKAKFFLPVLLFFSCFPLFPSLFLSNLYFTGDGFSDYASGKRALDKIGLEFLIFVFSLAVITTLDSLNCQQCSREICGYG